ncbi:MAG: hypothetical protein M1827_007468 [Pycnora praestabilis]|nr:MAG: hypothetical protein M1827_007468 [Pycnora praestabilis]
MDIGIGVLLGLCWIALTILSITTVLLQYVPQIFMTWKLQRVESLSILTTALQVPVFGAMAASWAVTVGIVGARGGTQGVYLGIGSTWMDWVLTAVGSGLLLSVCIYLEYVRGMRESDFIGVECEDRESGGGGEIEELEVAGRADERTQLLGE